MIKSKLCMVVHRTTFINLGDIMADKSQNKKESKGKPKKK